MAERPDRAEPARRLSPSELFAVHFTSPAALSSLLGEQAGIDLASGGRVAADFVRKTVDICTEFVKDKNKSAAFAKLDQLLESSRTVWGTSTSVDNIYAIIYQEISDQPGMTNQTALVRAPSSTDIVEGEEGTLVDRYLLTHIYDVFRNIQNPTYGRDKLYQDLGVLMQSVTSVDALENLTSKLPDEPIRPLADRFIQAIVTSTDHPLGKELVRGDERRHDAHECYAAIVRGIMDVLFAASPGVTDFSHPRFTAMQTYRNPFAMKADLVAHREEILEKVSGIYDLFDELRQLANTRLEQLRKTHSK